MFYFLQIAFLAVFEIVQVVGNWAISAIVPAGNDPLVSCRSLEPERVMHEPEAALAQARQAIGKVHLGDSKETVLSILSAPQGLSQLNLFKREAPSPIGIYYLLRTNWMPDDCLTDDELTPFIFRDGILVSIGWRTVSGPDSFGTPRIEDSHRDNLGTTP